MNDLLPPWLGPSLVAAAFVLLFCFQFPWPLRRWVMPKLRHLAINALAGAPGAILAQLVVFPFGLAITRWTAENHFGLLRLLGLPPWLDTAAGFLLLDFSFYYWHRLNHTWPLLWRFHNVHHVDPDLEVSTALRFHFGEVAFSTAFRLVQLTLTGASTLTYLIFEPCFMAEVMFHHSNVRLPANFERALNRILVTPRMHELHHSIVKSETNSNYSSFFSFWDRLHRSFSPMRPGESITIGVPAYRDPASQSVTRLLMLPFQRQRNYWKE